jgi:hypothetical protein
MKLFRNVNYLFNFHLAVDKHVHFNRIFQGYSSEKKENIFNYKYKRGNTRVNEENLAAEN